MQYLVMLEEDADFNELCNLLGQRGTIVSKMPILKVLTIESTVPLAELRSIKGVLDADVNRTRKFLVEG